MQSIHLAVKNSGAPLPSFMERGISDSQPGDIDDVNIMTYMEGGANIRYATGVMNIADHAHALLNHLVLVVTGLFKNIFRPITQVISFEVPTGIFTFDSLSEDQKASLRAMGLTEDISSKNTFTGSPSAADLNAIYSLGPVDPRFSPGSVPADGYLAYMYGLKAMGIFSNFSRKWVNDGGSWMMTKDADEMAESGFEVTRDSIEQAAVTFKHAPVGQYTHSYSGPLREIVYPGNSSKSIVPAIIRPSALISQWSPDGNYLFPYFHGMITPNKDLIWNVFGRVFFKGLSDSAEKATKIAVKLRGGFRKLSSTRAGMAMVHAFKGIDLAIASHSAIAFLIESGVYHGFVLTGSLRVIFYNSVIEPMSAEALIAAVKKLDRKARVLGEIVNVLNSPLNDSGMPIYSFTIDSINTSRKFISAYSSIAMEHLGSSLFTDTLAELVDEMFWGDNFFSPDQTKIMNFLRYVATGEESHIDIYPSYLAGGFFKNTSRIAKGLAIFGPKVPSLSYGTARDQVFSIPKEINAQDPNITEVDGTRPLRYLPFSLVAIQAGLTQWQSLFSTGQIRIPNGRKGKVEFTNAKQVYLQIGGNPAFNIAYNLIKDHSRAVRATGTQKRGQGTAGIQNSEGPGSRKRQKKDATEVAGEF